MSPRDHFNQIFHSPYFQSEEYKNSSGGKFEENIGNKVDKLFTIPRRFWAGIKKILWPLYYKRHYESLQKNP